MKWMKRTRQTILMLCAVFASSAASSEAPAWPPSLESLRDGDRCAERPVCDIDAEADELSAPFRRSAGFVRVLSTTASNCSSVVAVTDPRAKLGNVVTEPFGIGFRGSCVVSSKGKVIGAVHNGILATCQRTLQLFGATAVETAVVELAPAGEGRALVPVFGLPWLLVGQSECEIALDVRIQELPTEAQEPVEQ